MKKAAVMFLAALAVCLLAACGSSEEDTQAEGTAPAGAGSTEEPAGTAGLDYEELIIGVDDTFAPMGFLDENNELTGFDIDMANAVGEKLGIPVTFQTIEWSMKEQELNQGNIDLIWNGYSVTEERKQEVLFTNPYLDNKQVVVVMADSGIESLEDLAGKVVAAQEDSSAVEAIDSHPDLAGKVVAAQEDSSAVEAIDSHPDLAATFGDRPEFATNDMAIMDMEAGRSDAVVADSVLLDYVISHKEDPSQYRILEEDLGSEEFAVGVRKEDTALAEAINEAFAELKEDGTAAELSIKWFGEDIVK